MAPSALHPARASGPVLVGPVWTRHHRCLGTDLRDRPIEVGG